MSFLIGKGNKARESYPENRQAGGINDQGAFIFDDAVKADKSNIRGNQTDHALIDNTKHGILSAGHTTGTGYGTIADFATNGGGLNNSCSGIAGYVCGRACETAGLAGDTGGDANLNWGGAAFVRGAQHLGFTAGATITGIGNQVGLRFAVTMTAGGTALRLTTVGLKDFTPLFDSVQIRAKLPSGALVVRSVVSVSYDSGTGINIINIDSAIDLVSTTSFISNTSQAFCSTASGLGHRVLAAQSDACGQGHNIEPFGTLSSARGDTNFIASTACDASGGFNECWAPYGQSHGLGVVNVGQAARVNGTLNVNSADYASMDGQSNTNGNTPSTYTNVAGGVTITIAGDVRARFTNGETIWLTYNQPDGLIGSPTAYTTRVVSSVPAFGGGNTTFDIDSALPNGSTIGGSCASILVGSSSGVGGSGNANTGIAARVDGNANVNGASFANMSGESNVASTTAEASLIGGASNTVHGTASNMTGVDNLSSGSGDVTGGDTNVNNADDAAVFGNINRAGFAADTFTSIVGVLVTIAGNVTTHFVNTDAVTIVDQLGRSFRKTVASVPAFGGGNTTFNINSAIDTIVTTGTIVDTTIAECSLMSGESGVCTGKRGVVSGLRCTVNSDGGRAGGVDTTAGNLSDAYGDTVVCTGFTSVARGAGITTSGAYNAAFGRGHQCAVEGAFLQGEFAKVVNATWEGHSNGTFQAGTATAGDGQYGGGSLKGVGSGALAQVVPLQTGPASTSDIQLVPSMAYKVTVEALATTLALGAGARKSATISANALVSVTSAGVATVDATQALSALMQNDAAYVGSTLTFTIVGGALRANWVFAAGLGAVCQIEAKCSIIQVLGT